jgi:hypothetical protein
MRLGGSRWHESPQILEEVAWYVFCNLAPGGAKSRKPLEVAADALVPLLLRYGIHSSDSSEEKLLVLRST